MGNIIAIYLTRKTAYRMCWDIFDLARSLDNEDEAKLKLMEILDILLDGLGLSFEKFVSTIPWR